MQKKTYRRQVYTGHKELRGTRTPQNGCCENTQSYDYNIVRIEVLISVQPPVSCIPRPAVSFNMVGNLQTHALCHIKQGHPYQDGGDAPGEGREQLEQKCSEDIPHPWPSLHRRSCPSWERRVWGGRARGSREDWAPLQTQLGAPFPGVGLRAGRPQGRLWASWSRVGMALTSPGIWFLGTRKMRVYGSRGKNDKVWAPQVIQPCQTGE